MQITEIVAVLTLLLSFVGAVGFIIVKFARVESDVLHLERVLDSELRHIREDLEELRNLKDLIHEIKAQNTVLLSLKKED
ncbi:MAG: hypothetical protein U9P71_01095 [Campylobacterota bacterium]|nr:hypothetical protein [Campylobacterota bacterium]